MIPTFSCAQKNNDNMVNIILDFKYFACIYVCTCVCLSLCMCTHIYMCRLEVNTGYFPPSCSTFSQTGSLTIC